MQDLDMKDILYIGKRNEGWMKEFWREKQRERELKKKSTSLKPGHVHLQTDVHIYTRGGGNAGQFFNGSGRA